MSQANPPGRNAEYDRFGPWVLEINDDDPVPPLFAPYVTDAHEALLSIKVPRKLSRREARPGMDLYDYVLQLSEKEVTVHERVEKAVRSRTIAYGDIAQVRVGEQLLRGELLLGARGEGYTLPYNTVSRDLMKEVTRLIRERYLDPTAGKRSMPPSRPAEDLSFHFTRLHEEEATDGASQTLATQGTMPPGTLGRDGLRRWLDKLSGRRLLESLHICDGLELRLVDRGYTYAYRWQTIYGRRETFIPLINVREVGWQTSDDGTGTLTLRTDGGEGSWAFAGDLDRVQAYVDWLRHLA